MEATLIDGKPISYSGDISTIVDIQRLLWEACIGRLEVRLALFHGSDHALPLLGGTSDNGLSTPLYISFPLLFIYPKLASIDLHGLFAQCHGLVEFTLSTTRQVQRENQC
jgi:hypothetical protein